MALLELVKVKRIAAHVATSWWRRRRGIALEVRRIGVEDLADRPDAGLAQVRREALHEKARAGLIARMHAQPRVEERPHQPGPRRPLVIRGVARAQVPLVAMFVFGMVRRERSQAEGGEELLAH